MVRSVVEAGRGGGDIRVAGRVQRDYGGEESE